MSLTPDRRMRFVGVSTAQSSIMRVFPRWAALLGLAARLDGLDVALDAPPQRYRQVVRELQEDPQCVGALVTTHKIALYDAAADLFADLDPFARACGEISSIAVRDGALFGAAKDPITAGLSLQEFLTPDHFAGDAEVLCLGAGGAGTAIAWYLTRQPTAPARMTFVDTVADRLAHLQGVVGAHGPASRLHTLTTREVDLPVLVKELPPGSLVINATGLGKDRPGTPLPAETVLPERGVVWELNYRGSLEFLQQARAQQAERSLTVVDGWRYFIHGWSQVVAEVFGVDMTAEVVDALAREAEASR